MRDSKLFTYVYNLYVNDQYRATVDMSQRSSLNDIILEIHHHFTEGTMAQTLRDEYYNNRLSAKLVFVGQKVVYPRKEIHKIS